MSKRIGPFPKLRDAQAAASDPTVHASLSASAGTGKTQVLTARVLRLLLQGTAPSSILCLTFTKAGAAEMANRVGERLAHWVRLNDADLAAELDALGEPVTPPMRQRARRLFAKVLEAPGGGLRIQTIHSFAQTLLAAFPAEAGIGAGFRPIEGRAESELARQTLATLLTGAEAVGNKALLDDVSALSRRLGEQGAEDYLMQAARAHDAMAELGNANEIEPLIMGLIGVPSGNAEAELLQRLDDDHLPGNLLARLLAANRLANGVKASTIVGNLSAFLEAAPHGRLAMLDDVRANLATAKWEPAKAIASQIAADPDYPLLVAEFTEWWVDLVTLRNAASLAKIQGAGLRAGQAFAAAYSRAKRAMGAADFDDLIRWTRQLFEQPGMGDWVRYKLDQRTDHVLVDEAQDTNEDQWKIVDALAGEFFSGNPEAEGRWRTLFMVGDYKQAIFGFQGTSPNEYEKYRALTKQRADILAAAGDSAEIVTREFRELSVDASFRSSPAVLNVVDEMIGQLGHRAFGLSEPPNQHRAFHADRRGQVELWPPFDAAIAGDADDGEEGWVDDATRLYADAIARQVKQWIDEAPLLASTGKALTPGDILILVRSRKELASLIVARLYRHHVPVAGIDRLHLHKPLAVKDLLSAITFVAQPLDDLNLANLLVSPLIGWDQQALFDLSFGRDGKRLWTELQQRRDERADFAQAHAIVADWLAAADYVTPARFLETILSGPLDGRRKLIERLGEAARDPIEELVSSALAFEQEDTPSLDRFLAWFGRGDVEVKRDPSAPSDSVRVMTVHGSKGLEAPLVLIADAIHDPARVGGAQSVIDLPITGAGPVPLIRPRKDEAAPIFRKVMDDQKALDLEEHWRLAYVGLTRARERLIVAGVKPKKTMPSGTWYEAVEGAMQSIGAEAERGEFGGDRLIWRSGKAEAARAGRARRALVPIKIPDWARQAAPPEARPPRPLAPSQMIEDAEAMPPPTPEMREAARRGSLIHALFERLPGVEASDRHLLALRWLERQGVEHAAARDEMADAVCAILGEPRFAELFGPGSLAEAPIAATLPDGRVIAGTVDRLCIAPERIRLVDFKTGRVVPKDAASIPPSHRQQMQTYVEALRVIFPDRDVEAALLYTAGPRLIALPA
nr:double-strand break repair helicase AddA [uncultured Sphingomonas sp.]